MRSSCCKQTHLDQHHQPKKNSTLQDASFLAKNRRSTGYFVVLTTSFIIGQLAVLLDHRTRHLIHELLGKGCSLCSTFIIDRIFRTGNIIPERTLKEEMLVFWVFQFNRHNHSPANQVGRMVIVTETLLQLHLSQGIVITIGTLFIILVDGLQTRRMSQELYKRCWR